MSRIRLYFDEDAMQHALVVALRARRVDVLTASRCGMVNRSDEEHLRRANSDGRVLHSFNIRDGRTTAAAPAPSEPEVSGGNAVAAGLSLHLGTLIAHDPAL
jgi:hypothetical protein